MVLMSRYIQENSGHDHQYPLFQRPLTGKSLGIPVHLSFCPHPKKTPPPGSEKLLKTAAIFWKMKKCLPTGRP